MKLGDKIAKQRKELNYTQEQLAEILGVSRQSISKWESNMAYPETEKLIELGKIFDCSMDYLLKEEIAQKSGVAFSGLKEGDSWVQKKWMTDKNKRRVKKILKFAGIVLAALLAVDIISLIVYFSVIGAP